MKFRTLLTKEIRDHLMTFRFGAVLTTTFILVLLSFWVLGDDYNRRRAGYLISAETTARTNVEVYVPSQISPVLHRPPSALSVFAQGEDRRFGNSLQVHRWSVPYRPEKSFTDNMLLVSMPALDLYTIIALIISLFGILMSYDGVTSEREAGTLKMLSVSGSRRSSIFLAKFLGSLLCISLALAISLLCGLLLLLLIFGITFTGAQWLAIAGMALCAVLYASVFILIGLFFSSLVRRSATALIISLLVWTVLVLLLPDMARSASEGLVELPSPAEVSGLEQETLNNIVDVQERFFENNTKTSWGILTGGFNVRGNGIYMKFDSNEEAMRQAMMFTSTFEPMMQQRADQIWAMRNSHFNQKKRQARLEYVLAGFSPRTQLREAMYSLANTNSGIFDRFLEAARRYRNEMLETFKEKELFSRHAISFFTRWSEADIAESEWQKRLAYYQQELRNGKSYDDIWDFDKIGYLPDNYIATAFTMEDAPDFEHAFMPVAALLVFNTVIFLAGLAAIGRYDIR